MNHFDLNLVKVFLAIWDHRSLTAAGARLGLTQPAVSHSLRRLRDQFSDPLFTRVGNEMAPTEAAMHLHGSFERAMQLVSQTIVHSQEFVPEHSTRTFRIGMSDIAEYLYMPQLLCRLETRAPYVRIESVKMEVETIESKMRLGQVDMAIGYLPELHDCLDNFICHDTFVCMVRKDHPFRADRLTRDEFCALTFVDATRTTGYELIDRHLYRIGAMRKVSARLAHLTVVPEIVRRTNLAALYPGAASKLLNADDQFRLLSLPFELPKIPIQIHIHRKFSGDPGIRWLSKIPISL